MGERPSYPVLLAVVFIGRLAALGVAPPSETLERPGTLRAR